MEYLVNIEIVWPPDADPDFKERIFDLEAKRGRELQQAGLLKRLWRVPGRWANWSLYEARDATELHEAISSLPLWPWMQVTVHPLARHFNDPPASASQNDGD
jgi:muconolactone D-isomerase